VEGESYPADTDYPVAREGIVTPGYFPTFKTEILQGRAFSVNDHGEDQPVAVANRSFVQRFFQHGDAVGSRIRMGREDTDAQWFTIVGVVPDLYMEGFGNPDESPVGFYIPIAQSGVDNFVSIAAYTEGPPMAKTLAVREAVMAVDPNLPIFDVKDMPGVVEQFTWFYSVFGKLFMAFGAAALFLASVGLYGVMSFAVARRTQEMGIRMAMGAQGGELVNLMLKKGVEPVELSRRQLALDVDIAIYEEDTRPERLSPLVVPGVERFPPLTLEGLVHAVIQSLKRVLVRKGFEVVLEFMGQRLPKFGLPVKIGIILGHVAE